MKNWNLLLGLFAVFICSFVSGMDMVLGKYVWATVLGFLAIFNATFTYINFADNGNL